MRIKLISIFLIVLILIIGFSFVSSQQVKNSNNQKINPRVLISSDNQINQKNQTEIAIFIKINNKVSREQLKSVIGEENITEILSDGVTAKVSQETLDKIKNINGVESINPEGIKHIVLQNSVPLINATRVWALQVSGVNLTGKGQVICIIDTGVNYSHHDLGSCFGNNNPSSNCKIIGGYDYQNNDADPMDDNGHGTHVAGIAAANGTINGVAPEAKIIAIKACDSSGNCPDGEIAAGIEFCINNASLFNISVISMSLGGTLYTDYCNGDNLASYINSAVNKNISVVIASGNDYNATAISSPACVSTALPVTSSPKSDDSISLFANTWADPNKLIITAPGENINSTWINGGYQIDDGTSMATPHVAGAIAIIDQYLSLNGMSKSPLEIKILLNNTGKIIYDIYSGRNFSRINIYSAISSLDEIPSINFVSPTETSGSIINRNYVLINLSSNSLSIKNITLRFYNSTNNLINSSITTSSILFANFSNLSSGIYYFNATAYTLFGNLNNSETRNVTIDLVYPLFFNVSTIGELRRYTNFTANITLTDNYNLNFARLETNQSGNFANFTYPLSGINQTLSNSFNITTSLKAFSYRWIFNDSAGNTNSTSWQAISIVNTPPINLTIENQTWIMNSNLTINLSQYFTDLDNDELNYSSLSVNNISVSINQTTKIAKLIPDLGFNGTRYLEFIANDSVNITYSNNITLYVFKPIIAINQSAFDGLTTNFSNLTNFINISVIFEETSYGIINFSSISLNNNSIDIDNYINISQNHIEINSTALSFFNQTAILTMFNLTWTNPEILKDGANCTDCKMNSYNSSTGTFIFNVTGFSTYTTIEMLYCGDATCNNGEICSTCSSDCGTCSTSGGPGGGGGLPPKPINTSNLTIKTNLTNIPLSNISNPIQNNTNITNRNPPTTQKPLISLKQGIIIISIIVLVILAIFIFYSFKIFFRKSRKKSSRKKL